MELGFLPDKLGRGAVVLERDLLTSKLPFLPGEPARGGGQTGRPEGGVRGQSLADASGWDTK